MPTVPIIYYYPQKWVLERKSSQSHHSASVVIAKREPCSLCPEKLAVEKQVDLSLRICKETISLTKDKSPETLPPVSSWDSLSFQLESMYTPFWPAL